MKKLVVGITVVMLFLVGCGRSDELKNLSSLDSVDSEAEVSVVSLSATDKESLIYSQVSSRTLLDLTKLESPSISEVESVKTYMDTVNEQLIGQLKYSDGVIGEDFTNYLLYEFQKTPYYWQRSKMVILGIDSSSRSIVVDVTYKTLSDVMKTLKADSSIVLGEYSFKDKLRVRFERFSEIMNLKYGKSGDVDWEAKYVEFESVYGPLALILDEQQSSSLTDTVYTYGNQITYSGLVNNEIESSDAEMTVRYILTPNYSLGINLGLTCTQMYITSYNLNNSEVNTEEYINSSITDETGILESIKDTLRRYYISIDDENFSGIYSLSSNFGGLDKSFSDMFSTTYHKYDDFSVSIKGINGTQIICTVQASKKIRVRGSNMSLPIYTDTYYYILRVVDGELKVEEEILLISKLEGEPSINVDTADVTGFSSAITLSSDDKTSLEALIANFGVVQLNSDTLTSNFSDVVDTSISSSQLGTLKSNMLSLVGKQKVTWITSYLQGQGSYASIKCKEALQLESGEIYDCSVTYDFIMKGGSWYIYGYTVNSKVKIDSTDLSTRNCLSVVTKEGITEFDSKVESTGKTSVSEQVDSTVVDYPRVEPIIKDATNQLQVVDGVTGVVDIFVGIDNAKILEMYSKVYPFTDLDLVTERLESDELFKSSLVSILKYYNSVFLGESTYDLFKSNVSSIDLGEDFTVWYDGFLLSVEENSKNNTLFDLSSLVIGGVQ